MKKDKRLKWIVSRSGQEGHDFDTNLPAGRWIVTRNRRERTKQALTSADWTNTTGMWINDTTADDMSAPIFGEDYSTAADIIAELNPWSLFISLNSFDCRSKIGLELVLIELARKAGIRPLI